MPHDSPDAKVAAHPFETPAAEGVFKALLWVVLILQILLFAKAYERLTRNPPDRGHAAHWGSK
jgi:hypothetical protein